MQNNFNETLIDVRKAYRLIYDFQSRIMDLISFIGGSLDFEYDGGHIKFSDIAPANGKGTLKWNAWRFTPMYFYDFHFKSKKIANDNIYFSIFLLADTGYFEELEENSPNKKDVSTFKSVEQSETKLIFVAGLNKWGMSSLTTNNWNNIDFTTQPFGIDDKDSNGGKMIFKSYTLDNFLDEETCLKSLYDFQNFASSNNITFTVKEKELS